MACIPAKHSSSPTPTGKTAPKIPLLLLNYGDDAIGREAYVHGETGELFARCNMAIEQLEWDLGGGGTVYKKNPQFVVVKWSEPGHYTGRVSGVTPAGPVESTFEYDVVPSVLRLDAGPTSQEIRLGQPVAIKVVTSHPAAAIEWRSREEGGPLETGSGADISLIYRQAICVSTMEVRTSDGHGHWGPWQQVNSPVMNGPNTHGGVARPNIPSGVVGEVVTASLNAEYEATRVEWFLGEGAERIGGSDVQPQLRLLKPGWHGAAAQAFVGDEPRLAYPTGYFVAHAEPQQWTQVPVTSLSAVTGGSVATVLDGRPVVAGYVPDTTSGGYKLLIAIAKQPAPKSPEDWHITALKSSAVEGTVLLAEHNRLLQVLHPSDDFNTEWSSATIALPSAPNDWTTQTIGIQKPVDLTFVDGRLVVAAVRDGNYYENSALILIMQLDKSKADRRMIEFPALVPKEDEPFIGGHSGDMEVGMTGGRPSPYPRPEATAQLLVIDDRLIVPHRADDRLAVAVALTTHPDSVEDFSQYLLPSGAGNQPVAGFVNKGRLIIPVDRYRALAWYEASTAVPLTAADWDVSRSDINGFDAFGFREQGLIDDSMVVLALRYPAYPILLRGTPESLRDPGSWEPIYLPGSYSSDTSALLDTDAGLAILLGRSDGPVLLYPDLPTAN